MPSTPQLSDESVLSILDGMSWDDIEEEEGKGQEQEQSLNTDSLLQEIQQEVEVKAITSALGSMINGKSATFESSSSILRERASEGEDVVVGGNSGDASINLDINQLLRWENALSGMSNNSSGSNNSDSNFSRSSSITVGTGFEDQRSESDKIKGVAET